VFQFSKPIDPTTVTAATFTLIGPDGNPVTPASIQQRFGDREVQVTYNQLALGQYQYQVEAPDVLDTAGIALGTSVLTTDFTVQPFSAEWINSTGGSWNTGANWNTGVVPGAQDDVLIALPVGKTVTFATTSDTVAELVTTGGNTLAISSATLTVTGETNIGGTLTITGGTFAANGGATITNLTISGGTLNLGGNNATVTTFTDSPGGVLGVLEGTGTLTVSGPTALSGNAIMEGGSASLRQGNLVAQGPLSITVAGGNGTGAVLDGGWTLTAEDSTTWTSGPIYFGSPFSALSIGGTNTFVNAAGATFDNQTTANSNIIRQTGTGVFDNAGLFDKTAASGSSTTTISTAFNNTGTLEVDAGTVDLTGGGSDSGSFTGAGTLEFGGGTATVATGSSVTAANVLVAGGTVNLSGGSFAPANLTITSGTVNLGANNATVTTFTQSGGELAGTGTLTVSGATALSGENAMEGGSTSLRQGNLVAQGPLTITGGNGIAAVIDGGWTLTADGTTNWTSGTIDFGAAFVGLIGGTNTFVNAAGATFDDQNSATNTFFNGIFQESGTGVFDNAGLFDKTAASGASTTVISTAFNNSGTLEVDAGTVDLTGGGVVNSGKLWADGGNLTVTGSLTGSGSDEITGNSMIEFGGAVASGQAMSFDTGSTGTLLLDKSQSFAGTVAGLAQNGSNFLDLSDITFGAATKATYSGTSSSGTLQVTDGTHTAEISLLGNYTASTFVTASDGHGGTLVHDPAVALLVQAAASFAPSPGLGETHGQLTPPPESARPLLAAHAV
jgi:hypothetical protein